jgi:hypothetical protein
METGSDLSSMTLVPEALMAGFS